MFKVATTEPTENLDKLPSGSLEVLEWVERHSPPPSLDISNLHTEQERIKFAYECGRRDAFLALRMRLEREQNLQRNAELKGIKIISPKKAYEVDQL